MSSYVQIGSQASFAQHGRLVADYPAGTPAIDDTVGLLVQLDGVDVVVEEQSLAGGLADRMLVFVEREILSVFGAELKGPALYRVMCLRGRFGTAAAAHAAGAEVWLIPRAGLQPIKHPHFQPGNLARVKVAGFRAQRTPDLSQVEAMEVSIEGTMFRSAQPSNLRVNGDANAPSYASGAGIRIDWSLPQARSELGKAAHLSFRTQIDFLDGETVKGTTTVSTSYLKLTNVELVKLLGGAEISFTVRARTKSQARDVAVLSDPVALFVLKL